MRWILSVFVFLTFTARAATWATKKPKLVVVISIDQFRADYLSRFQAEFGRDGFLALMREGAYFPYAEYDVLQSMTAPGHATILTGAFPYQMGIPLNEWWDQKNAKVEYCVEDDTTQLVGVKTAHAGASPRKLIGSTVGDELKNAGGQGKIVSFAIKDRAAILMGGHRPDLAFWFDRPNKQWTTSTYYRDDLPKWLSHVNQTTSFADCELHTPCSAGLTVEAFKAALRGEELGRHKDPDLLAVGFSGHDFAGHRYGPNSEEMHRMTLAEDHAIAELRAATAAYVPGGNKNVLFVLTADHGVAPTNEYLEAAKIASENIDEKALSREIDARLTKVYGKAKFGAAWIAHTLDFNFFVEDRNIVGSKATRAQVEGVIKTVLLEDGRFAQVITRTEFENHLWPPGVFAGKLEHTYYPGRSGLVIGLQKPYYLIKSENAASHMTGYTYDRTVPLIFAGFGIKSGVYGERVGVVDIAPTLSFLLGVLPPAVSEGRVLTSALRPGN